MERFWSKVKKSKGCWEWIGARREAGYGQFHFHGKPVKAHRVAWNLTYGDIPFGKFVCHKCDNPPCVNPAHLFLATNKENIIDSVNKGRWHRIMPTIHARGEQCSLARLKESDIPEIRLLNGKLGVRAIGRKFGVTHSTILAVLTGKTWRHVK